MKRIFFSRPRDKSLQAYKAWILNTLKRINPDAKDDSMTEEKWIEHWQKFWSKADDIAKSQETKEE
jgi:hypothetical protein